MGMRRRDAADNEGEGTSEAVSGDGAGIGDSGGDDGGGSAATKPDDQPNGLTFPNKPVAPGKRRRLRVFILAGQTNMEGPAKVAGLSALLEPPPKLPTPCSTPLSCAC